MANPVLRAEWESLEKVPVKSENVRSLSHNPTTGTMFIEFNSGNVYAYFRVEDSVYQSGLTAPSVGRWVWEVVRAKGSDSRFAYQGPL